MIIFTNYSNFKAKYVLQTRKMGLFIYQTSEKNRDIHILSELEKRGLFGPHIRITRYIGRYPPPLASTRHRCWSLIILYNMTRLRCLMLSLTETTVAEPLMYWTSLCLRFSELEESDKEPKIALLCKCACVFELSFCESAHL